jgi:hypothetical protein
MLDFAWMPKAPEPRQGIIYCGTGEKIFLRLSESTARSYDEPHGDFESTHREVFIACTSSPQGAVLRTRRHRRRLAPNRHGKRFPPSSQSYKSLHPQAVAHVVENSVRAKLQRRVRARSVCVCACVCEGVHIGGERSEPPWHLLSSLSA